MKDQSAIQSFLACRRIALVGASRDPKDFSRALMRAFLQRGYDVVPVNPAANRAEMEGRRCLRSVVDATPPVEAALLLTPPAHTAAAVMECVAAGVRRIWMHKGAGAGAASPDALALCARAGLEVVTGECPFMYLPDAGLPHRIHGFLHRLLRRAA